jgi:hypothetical protein
VIVEGKVLEADPPSRPVQTWDPVGGQEFAAEALTLLTWEIDQGEGGVNEAQPVTHELGWRRRRRCDCWRATSQDRWS